MTELAGKLDQLMHEARRRDLTPRAWWIGSSRHRELVAEGGLRDRSEMEGERFAAIDGLPVKVLLESPERLALWCDEGALDL